MEPYSNETIKLDSIKNYELAAKKLVAKTYPILAERIFNDTEWFGEVISTIIEADLYWNGNGSKFGYRKQRLKWYMCKAIKQRKKRNVEVYLDDTLLGSGMIQSEIKDIDDKDTYDKFVELFDSSGLSNNEKECMVQYYVTGNTVEDIGNNLECTRQSVYNRLESACHKLKKKAKQINVVF